MNRNWINLALVGAAFLFLQADLSDPDKQRFVFNWQPTIDTLTPFKAVPGAIDEKLEAPASEDEAVIDEVPMI